MLEEQCRTWTGITSVAVYWPLIYFQPNNTANLEEAKVTVRQFHDKMENLGRHDTLSNTPEDGGNDAERLPLFFNGFLQIIKLSSLQHFSCHRTAFARICCQAQLLQMLLIWALAF